MLIFITAGPICTSGAGATLNFLGAPAPLGHGAATTRLAPPLCGGASPDINNYKPITPGSA